MQCYFNSLPTNLPSKMNFVLLLMICYSYCRADHIIFEQVGEMASSVTYLHVKMEINLDEIHTLASTYDHLIDHIKTHSEKEKNKALDAIMTNTARIQDHGPIKRTKE